LLKHRLQHLRLPSRTSVREMHLRARLIPEIMYQHFVSAFKRACGVPTRCYLNRRSSGPSVEDWQSVRAGSLRGDILCETEPQLTGSAALPPVGLAWAGVALALSGLGAIYASILLMQGIAAFSAFIASLLAIRYGLRILHTAEMFSTECIFESKLALISVEGGYNTSRYSAAAPHGRDTATRDVLDVDVEIRTIYVDLVSTVFAKPGRALPFRDSPRFVLAFDTSDHFADFIFDRMTNTMGDSSSGPQLPPGGAAILPR